MPSTKRTFKILFVIYFVLLFVFVVVKFNGSFDTLTSRIEIIERSRAAGYWNINLTPFDTLDRYIGIQSNGFAFFNLWGNIIPFLPLGFLLPGAFFKPPTFLKTIGSCLLTILCIETFQFFTLLGYFDIDDIILNFLGCLIGYLFFAAYRGLARQAQKHRTGVTDEQGWKL